MSGTSSISGAEIESQPAVWARVLLERDRSALGLPGERVFYVDCGAPAFVASAFVAKCLASLRERAGLGETDAACAS